MCIELGFLLTNPTIMYEDCQAAVAFSKENRFRNRSKHISLRWSFVVERQSLAIREIVGISRTGMLADIFCSPRTTSQNTHNVYFANGKTLSFDNKAPAKGNVFAAIAEFVFH